MSQLSEEELRFIHYWHGSVFGGKKFLLVVLDVYTKGKITTTNTFKDFLFDYYKYLIDNNKTKKTQEGLYKNDFTEAERRKLEDPVVDIYTFDVTFTEKLLRRLRHLTRFADHNDPIWSKDEPAGSNTSIEHLIFKVKYRRNDASHSLRSLSKTELSDELKMLEDLYTKLIETVLTTTSKTPQIILDRKKEINDFFVKLRNPIREPLTDKDIDAYKKEKRAFRLMIRDEVRKKSEIHLREEFKDLRKIKTAGWLDLDLQVDTLQIFTDIVVKDEEKNIPNSGPIYERKINYKDILQTKTKNQETPKIITISSTGGNGKTIYTRFFIYKWCDAQLKDVDLLFLAELRNETSKTLDEFIRTYLGDVMDEIGISFQNLKDTILSMRVVVILDGYDESEQNDLLKSILKTTETNKNFTTMITTRPTASLNLQKVISGYNLTELQLNLLGIAPENQFEFIKKHAMAMVSDQNQIDKILESVEVGLPFLNESMGEILQSPLMLTFLTILWVYGQIPIKPTITEVFMKVNELLKGKLEERILQKNGPIIDCLVTSINDFEVDLNEFSFKSFSRMEFNIKDSSIADLRKRLQQLTLGHYETEVLEHYLVARKSRRMLVPVITYSFKHMRLQEYSAGKHVSHVLANGTEDDKAAILGHLKEDRYINIRAHAIALLSKDNPAGFAKYAQIIIGFEKDGEEVDSLLNLIFESNKHPTVVKIVSDIMTQRQKWKVCSTSVISSLADILKHVQPLTLEMNFRNHTKFPQSLPEYLQTIAKVHRSMKVELYFPCYLKDNTVQETHDEYLRALSGPAACTTLTKFTGRLDITTFPDLPSSLEFLCIGFQMDGLPLLMQRIPDLPQLSLLYITTRCEGLAAVLLHLPPTQPSPNLRLVDVHLRNCCDADTDNVAALAHRCSILRGSQGILSLSLFNATITGGGGVALLQRLVDMSVNCFGINIWSSHVPEDAQEQQLKQLANICVTGMFDWMYWYCGDVTLKIK